MYLLSSTTNYIHWFCLFCICQPTGDLGRGPSQVDIGIIAGKCEDKQINGFPETDHEILPCRSRGSLYAVQ